MGFIETETIPNTSSEAILPVSNPHLQILSEHGLLLAGLSTLRTGFFVERPGRRPYHIVIMTTSGRGVLEFEDGGRREVSSGDLFVSPAHGGGHRHYPAGESWTICWFRLAVGAHWESLRNSSNEVRGGKQITRVANTMRRLLQECTGVAPNSDRLIELYCEELLILLRRELMSRNSPPVEACERKLDALWGRLGSNLSADWTVDRMARVIHMSRTHFFRNCRRLYGEGPSAKLRELRLNRAASLLVHFDYPVSVVADRVGYASVYSFSKAFKQFFGLAPRAYRVARLGRARS